MVTEFKVGKHYRLTEDYIETNARKNRDYYTSVVLLCVDKGKYEVISESHVGHPTGILDRNPQWITGTTRSASLVEEAWEEFDPKSSNFNNLYDKLSSQ